MKTNASGDHVWNRDFSDYLGSSIGYSVIQTSTGRYVFTGVSESNLFAIQVNSDGSFYWYGWLYELDSWCNGYDEGRCIRLANDNNLMIVGQFAYSDSDADWLILKLDNYLNQLWYNTWGSYKKDYYHSITPLPNGTFVTQGIIEEASNNWDIFIKRHDENGVDWYYDTYQYGGSANDGAT